MSLVGLPCTVIELCAYSAITSAPALVRDVFASRRARRRAVRPVAAHRRRNGTGRRPRRRMKRQGDVFPPLIPLWRRFGEQTHVAESSPNWKNTTSVSSSYAAIHRADGLAAIQFIAPSSCWPADLHLRLIPQGTGQCLHFDPLGLGSVSRKGRYSSSVGLSDFCSFWDRIPLIDSILPSGFVVRLPLAHADCGSMSARPGLGRFCWRCG